MEPVEETRRNESRERFRFLARPIRSQDAPSSVLAFTAPDQLNALVLVGDCGQVQKNNVRSARSWQCVPVAGSAGLNVLLVWLMRLLNSHERANMNSLADNSDFAIKPFVAADIPVQQF